MAWVLVGNIKGAKGDDGDAGSSGASAYAIAVANGFSGTEAAWLASLVGAAGENGTNGIDGQDGASAYEIASANGFVGDEAAWLASLVGPIGATGSQGIQGNVGATGAAGAAGADGQSAYELAVSEGFIGTLSAWLDSLVGPTGATGATGSVGATGATGATGSVGATGSAGADGVGVPAGGTTGQVLAKTSATDFATEWVDPAGGGAGSTVTVSDTAPSSPAVGDQWFDTTTGIQYTRVGTSWVEPY